MPRAAADPTGLYQARARTDGSSRTIQSPVPALSGRPAVNPLPASSKLAHDLRASNLSTEHLQSATSPWLWPITTCQPDATSAGGPTMNHSVDRQQVQQQASYHSSRVKRGDPATGVRRHAPTSRLAIQRFAKALSATSRLSPLALKRLDNRSPFR